MDPSETERLLRSQRDRYPGLTVRDMIKCLYQSEFGCGHLVEESPDGLGMLLSELSDAPETDEPVEEIGERFCRVHLGGLRKLGIGPEELYKLFVRSAPVRAGTVKDLLTDLETLRRMMPETEKEIDAYIAAGCPAVRHSPEFRDRYHPAYRVVCKELLDRQVPEKSNEGGMTK